MTHVAPLLALVAGLVAVRTPQQEAAPEPAPLPTATALEQGVSPDGLAALDELVRSFVDAGEIVGAELMVIVDGHTILHDGYGWRDREGEVPMEPGGVFCVRSMTKPLIGAAVWMLIDEHRLKLGDRAAQYLPSFDVDSLREITIEQLLRHQSGLPMSLIMGSDPRTLESVRAVADLAGTRPLEFEPGTAIGYSDQGTDTLTAVIEVVTGAPAKDFVRERLLEPLGMRDTACLMTEDHPLRARVCSNYAGSPGAWTRYWSAEDAPLFPVFLGSQALYSTCADYARFLDLYLQRGRVGGERLLRTASLRHTLEPGPWPLAAGSGFPGLRVGYGTLMQLWTEAGEDDEDGAREVVVFGHTGSDGTHAWAFPEQEALVMYFTQSRGTTTGARVEERLAGLFLGAPFDPLQAAPPLEEYFGYYWEGENDLYRAVVRDGNDLAWEILGKAVVPLDYIGGDRWKLRPEPGTVLEFDRDTDGRVVGYHVGDHREFRVTPSADLPSADEVAARVAAAHHLERLAESGPLLMRGSIDLPKLGRHGTSTTWLAWPDRWRIEEALDEESGRVAFDGTTVRSATSRRVVAPMEGAAAKLMAESSPFVRFGDWRALGVPFEVVQRLRRDDEEALIVRLGEPTEPALTLYVDGQTGLVGRVDSMTFLEGVGRIGQRVVFSDYRDTGGALLPWRTKIELAHLIGTIESVFETVELGVETPEGFFELSDG